MAYDLGKIPALEAHKQIIDHISKQLAACSEFANNSLCYFGLDLSYTIKVTLYSRGKTELHVSGGRQLGDNPDDPVIQMALAEEGAELETSHVEIADGVLAGTAKSAIRTTAGTKAGEKGSGSQAGGGAAHSKTVGAHGAGSRTPEDERAAGGTGKLPPDVDAT